MDEDLQRDKLLADFFQERIMPLANAARERDQLLFPTGFDKDRESYFVERSDQGDLVAEAEHGRHCGGWRLSRSTVEVRCQKPQERLAPARRELPTFQRAGPEPGAPIHGNSEIAVGFLKRTGARCVVFGIA